MYSTNEISKREKMIMMMTTGKIVAEVMVVIGVMIIVYLAAQKIFGI